MAVYDPNSNQHSDGRDAEHGETNIDRYILFAGSQYYPIGGINDMKGTFNTVQYAENAYQKVVVENWWDWAHIVDRTDLKVVKTIN